MRSDVHGNCLKVKNGHRAQFNTYSMKTYVLLHFEHTNEVTVIIKLLCRATSCRRVALCSLMMIVTSFYVQNVIEHWFSWNKCFINFFIPDECRKK